MTMSFDDTWQYRDPGDTLPGYILEAQPDDKFEIRKVMSNDFFTHYSLVHYSTIPRIKVRERAYFVQIGNNPPCNIATFNNGGEYFLRYLEIASLTGEHLNTYAIKIGSEEFNNQILPDFDFSNATAAIEMVNNHPTLGFKTVWRCRREA